MWLNFGLPLFICNLLHQKLCAQIEFAALTASPAFAGQAGWAATYLLQQHRAPPIVSLPISKLLLTQHSGGYGGGSNGYSGGGGGGGYGGGGYGGGGGGYGGGGGGDRMGQLGSGLKQQQWGTYTVWSIQNTANKN